MVLYKLFTSQVFKSYRSLGHDMLDSTSYRGCKTDTSIWICWPHVCVIYSQLGGALPVDGRKECCQNKGLRDHLEEHLIGPHSCNPVLSSSVSDRGKARKRLHFELAWEDFWRCLRKKTTAFSLRTSVKLIWAENPYCSSKCHPSTCELRKNL